MIDKKIIIVLKTKSDEDVIGFYMGDLEKTDTSESAIMVYRPLCIKLIEKIVNNTVLHQYVTYPYFQYGSKVVTIPHSEIITKDKADPFFVTFYERALGQHIVKEDEIHSGYTKYFEKQDLAEIMEKTDSLYIEQPTEYKQ